MFCCLPWGLLLLLHWCSRSPCTLPTCLFLLKPLPLQDHLKFGAASLHNVTTALSYIFVDRRSTSPPFCCAAGWQASVPLPLLPPDTTLPIVACLPVSRVKVHEIVVVEYVRCCDAAVTLFLNSSQCAAACCCSLLAAPSPRLDGWAQRQIFSC